MPAAFLLAAARRRRSGWPAAAVAVAALAVVGGFGALLATRHVDPLARWLGGLPLPLGLLVWVMACAPLVTLGLLFGLGWHSWRPSGKAVDELRRLAAAERDDD
jgi:hypothetical protein